MITFKLDVADRAVLQDYRQVRDDGAELVGHGVFLADPATAGLLWWFFDSARDPRRTRCVARVPTASWVLGPRGEHRFWISDDQLRPARAPGILRRATAASYRPLRPRRESRTALTQTAQVKSSCVALGRVARDSGELQVVAVAEDVVGSRLSGQVRHAGS